MGLAPDAAEELFLSEGCDLLPEPTSSDSLRVPGSPGGLWLVSAKAEIGGAPLFSENSLQVQGLRYGT